MTCTPRPCSVDDCTSPVKARGWCNRHWLRWKKHGDPLAGPSRYSTLAEAFAARTQPGPHGCLVWTGSNNGRGYGTITWQGKRVYPHRYAWEQAHGPIPDGMFVDHICHNRACCSIFHLRLVSTKQNNEHRTGAQENNLSTGVRGVSLHKPTGRYVAQVGHNGTNHYCGLYDTIAEAEAAARARRLELFSHNTLDRTA